MRKIIKKWPFMNLCENNQEARHKIMLANVVNSIVDNTIKSEVHAVSKPFKCREYYGDALFTIHTGIKINEYSFNTTTTKWEGKYIITTYIQSHKAIRRKLKIINNALKNTAPMIKFERLNTENILSQFGDENETCGFLVKVPTWYNKTLARSSLFTALLRILYYNDPLNLTSNDIYAEYCVSSILNSKYMNKHVYKNTLWNNIFFPALRLPYENCMCMNNKDFEELKEKVKERNYYYVHASSGIQTVWISLQQYLKKSDAMKEFNKLRNITVNGDLLGNLIAIDAEVRSRENAA